MRRLLLLAILVAFCVGAPKVWTLTQETGVTIASVFLVSKDANGPDIYGIPLNLAVDSYFKLWEK